MAAQQGAGRMTKRQMRAALRAKEQAQRPPPAPRAGQGRRQKPQPKPQPKREPRNRDGEMLTRHLVAPRPAIRFPTVDAPLTAVATLRRTLALPTPNPGDPNGIWNAGDLVFAMYGQPGLLAIIGPVYVPASQTGSSGSASQYTCSFVTEGGTSTASDWVLTNPVVGVASGSTQPTTPWPLAKCVGGSTSYLAATQATQKPIGWSQNRPYLMLSGYEQLYVSVSGGTGTNVASYTFCVRIYTGPGQAPSYETITIAAENGKVPLNTVLIDAQGATRPTFYCLEFVGVNPVNPDLAVTTTQSLRLRVQNPSASYMWAQLYCPDLDVDPSIGESCRRTSCSLTLQNTSAMVNRQGTVIAARQVFNSISDYSPSTLSSAAQRYQGDAAKGIYTYMEFTSEDERFATAVNEHGGVQFNLDSEDMVHLIQVSCPSYATLPNAYALTIDTALEFKTQSQRYSLGVARTSHGELIAARRMANLTPWFFECESEDPAKVVSKVLQAWRRGVTKRDYS